MRSFPLSATEDFLFFQTTFCLSTKQNGTGSTLSRMEWTNFLGDGLCPEDIGKPRKILEIGAGSGAWAIHAAKLYPEADVLAIDMNPLPARPLPPNLSYQQVNILEPFPFPAGTFDVVHIRLVLIHLPDAFSVLSRIIDLVAPGGWLLADDLDWVENFEGLDNAPGIKGGLLHVIRSTQAVKGDPHIGPTLKPGCCVFLNAIPEGTEADLAEFSRLFKETLTRAVAEAPLQTPAQKEMQKGFIDDMARGGDWKYSVQFYFTWSKKRV
ncbi:Methyltransferase str2 [Mycena venus]|uniref:Methyltransferase str2 n=1 Tax=Mycena venus TaxID=2733690 RepID=A0A8H6YL76_9AGAR|nr:Methyltransferase str2 [Mycena venus]